MIPQQQDPKDETLWRIAKKRVNFKTSFYTYLVVNIFLWAIWYFTDGSYRGSGRFIPWPAWVTLGWGLGIAFQYSDAYLFDKSEAAEKEYEKLKNKNSKI